MNTIRLFSLITLLGLATSQAVAMDNQALDAIFEKETKTALIDLIPVTAAQEIVNNPQVKEIASTWAPSARELVNKVLTTGKEVLVIPVNHPYYTAGAIAIIGGSYVVYKLGNIESIKNFLNNNKKALGLGLIGTTALVGSAYAANHYGYVPSMETVKNTTTGLANSAWNKRPNMPKVSMPSFSIPSMPSNKTLAIGGGTAAALGLGYYAVNKYKNQVPAIQGNKEETKNPVVTAKPSSSTATPKTEETKNNSWFGGMFSGSSANKTEVVDKKQEDKNALVSAINTLIISKNGDKKQNVVDAAAKFNNQELNDLVEEMFKSTVDLIGNNWALNFTAPTNTATEKRKQEVIANQPGVKAIFDKLATL